MRLWVRKAQERKREMLGVGREAGSQGRDEATALSPVGRRAGCSPRPTAKGKHLHQGETGGRHQSQHLVLLCHPCDPTVGPPLQRSEYAPEPGFQAPWQLWESGPIPSSLYLFS